MNETARSHSKESVVRLGLLKICVLYEISIFSLSIFYRKAITVMPDTSKLLPRLKVT